MNINKERTLSELGIDIDCLPKFSHKRVFSFCESCKKDRLVKFSDLNKGNSKRCRSCCDKEAGLKRRKLTKYGDIQIKYIVCPEQKLAQMKINKERRSKYMSSLFSGENHPMYGKKHSKETLEKISITSRKNAKRGKLSPLYGNKYLHKKHIPYIRADGSIVKMKSMWEIKMAEHLDLNKINWEYEKVTFPIVYFYKGCFKEGTYTPDFFLNDEILEIKGYWMDDSFIKFINFVTQYPHVKIRVLGRRELKDLGIKIK